MTQDKRQRVKRMLSGGTFVEKCVVSLEAVVSANPEVLGRVRRTPGFIASMVEKLLDRVSPHFDHLSDDVIAKVTDFQESQEGRLYYQSLDAFLPHVQEIGQAWMIDVQMAIEALPQ